MKKKSSLHSVSSMLDGVLARHGIAKQVMAAQLVDSANGHLRNLLPEHAVKDIRALSYKEGILTLACRHSVAVYDAEGIAPLLSKKLEEDQPSLMVKTIARLRPEVFEER